MNRVSFHRAFLRGNLIGMIGVLLCVYFSYHAISGQRSLLRLHTLNVAIEKEVANKDNAIEARQSLASNVHMMRPGQVDRDLLEERVRLTLGYKQPGEITIMRN